MATYSLLQVSLDQTIDRESLEDASVVARSVARADCAKIQRELFGVMITGLPHEEALALKAELKRRNFPTTVVLDDDLPILHDPFTIQRIEVKGEVLLFTDFMRHEHPRAMKELVFIAGGFIRRVEFKTDRELKVSPQASTRGGAPSISITHHAWEETAVEFRVDFFFLGSPNRLRANLAAETSIFYQGEPLRLRQSARLLEMMAALRSLVPPDRSNSGLKTADADFVYPSLQSYEKEIRWHFHRLKPAS